MQATRKCSRLSACRGNIVEYKRCRLSALGRCVILILLSAVWSAAAARQCYWCGPLSEQVHRSRRVLPCGGGGPLTTTDCDPGYNHCAIIATAPNFVESRLCVKLYQDECYPTFCNSSKVWRMTCPCRGELCNGPNTERETEAFEILKKLVAKTQTRIKKRSSKLDTDELMLNMGNNDITERNYPNNFNSADEKVSAMAYNDTSKTEKITNVTINKENDNIVTETKMRKKDVSGNEQKLDEMQSDQPNNPDKIDDNEANLKVQMENNNFEKGLKNTEEPKTGKIYNETSVKVNLETQMLRDLKEQPTAAANVTEKLREPHNEVKTSPKLPALQPIQMSTDVTKTTQPTSSFGETNTTKEQTTGPTKPSKNSAISIYLHAILLVKWLVMYFCS